MKKGLEKVFKNTLCRPWAVLGRFSGPPPKTARLLMLPIHSARRFSTRHNFFDITPNQVIQKPKLIYSTSSTTFMKNLKTQLQPQSNAKHPQVRITILGPSKMHNSFNSKPNEAIQVPKFIYLTRATIIF